MTSILKRTSSLLFLAIIFLSACGGSDNYISENTLYVAPYTTACVIDGQSRQCLVVADQPEGPYYTFFNTINGFNYQPGYQYEIIVKETLTVSSNGQQTITYDLVSIVSQTPVTQPTPSPTPIPTPTPPVPGGSDYTIYSVRPGDTLNEIAVAFDVPRSQIICANNIHNINDLEVGQQLIIPFTGNWCSTQIYIVQPGDTLSAIATRFGLSVYELAAYNGVSDINNIEVGDVLYIPPPGTVNPRQ